jgi:uncharacterized membrane protein YkvI
MILLAAQYSFWPRIGMIALIYLVSAGLVAAVVLAGAGHRAYLLAALGAALIIIGALPARAYLQQGQWLTAVGAGVALVLIGVALDLIVGPVNMSSEPEEEEHVQRGFE